MLNKNLLVWCVFNWGIFNKTFGNGHNLVTLYIIKATDKSWPVTALFTISSFEDSSKESQVSVWMLKSFLDNFLVNVIGNNGFIFVFDYIFESHNPNDFLSHFSSELGNIWGFSTLARKSIKYPSISIQSPFGLHSIFIQFLQNGMEI